MGTRWYRWFPFHSQLYPESESLAIIIEADFLQVKCPCVTSSTAVNSLKEFEVWASTGEITKSTSLFLDPPSDCGCKRTPQSLCWLTHASKQYHARYELVYLSPVNLLLFTFNASILLVGHQEENPACKILSDEVLAWLSVSSEVRMICIWSSWCHCYPIISCFIKIQKASPFWWRLIIVVLGKKAVKWILSKKQNRTH